MPAARGRSPAGRGSGARATPRGGTKKQKRRGRREKRAARRRARQPPAHKCSSVPDKDRGRQPVAAEYVLRRGTARVPARNREKAHKTPIRKDQTRRERRPRKAAYGAERTACASRRTRAMRAKRAGICAFE